MDYSKRIEVKRCEPLEDNEGGCPFNYDTIMCTVQDECVEVGEDGEFPDNCPLRNNSYLVCRKSCCR